MTQPTAPRNRRQAKSLQEMEEWLGRKLPAGEGADEVTRSDIRRRLEVVGFDCPLHYDAAVAKRHGYRDIVAPAIMVGTFALPAYWKPGDPEPHPGEPPLMPTFSVSTMPMPGTRGIVTDIDVEYGEPVYPGDRISWQGVLTKIVPKRTRIGEGAFITARTVYWKQTGEVVATEDLTTFSYTPDEST